MSFFEDMKSGKKPDGESIDNIQDHMDDCIDQWHAGGSDQELHEYLGFNWHEYALLIENPHVVANIPHARFLKIDINYVRLIFRELKKLEIRASLENGEEGVNVVIDDIERPLTIKIFPDGLVIFSFVTNNGEPRVESLKKPLLAELAQKTKEIAARR